MCGTSGRGCLDRRKMLPRKWFSLRVVGRISRLMTATGVCLLLASCCIPRGVHGDLFLVDSNTISPSPAFTSAVGTSSVTPPPPSPSPSSSPSSISPSSSPIPPYKPVLEFVLNDTLFIRIETITIYIYPKQNQVGYYNLTLQDYPALQSQPTLQNATATHSGDKITFWKKYMYNKPGQPKTNFSINFTFQLEPTSNDQTWYISSFSHRNRSDVTPPPTNKTACTFQYSMSQAVHAPSSISYFCSDMKFRGNCVDNIKSEIHFEDLWVQAFQLKNGKPSSTKDNNNSIINIVVGSVVGSTLAIALIVIVVTLVIKVIKKRVRWRGYNLLDD